jgi:hypothetical protein
VIETFESPEKYEIELDVDGDLILATVQLDDLRSPHDARSPVNVLGHPILNARREVGDAGVSCATPELVVQSDADTRTGRASTLT